MTVAEMKTMVMERATFLGWQWQPYLGRFTKRIVGTQKNCAVSSSAVCYEVYLEVGMEGCTDEMIDRKLYAMEGIEILYQIWENESP